MFEELHASMMLQAAMIAGIRYASAEAPVSQSEWRCVLSRCPMTELLHCIARHWIAECVGHVL